MFFFFHIGVPYSIHPVIQLSWRGIDEIDNSKKLTKWENISVWENFLGLGKATGKGEGGLIDVYFLGGGKSYQKRMGAHFFRERLWTP